MLLKAVYTSQSEIPEKFQELYSERNGQWELTGVEGVKTQADIDRSTEALRKERDAHKATKETLKKFDKLGDMDLDELLGKVDRIEELEAAAAGKTDDEKINAIVETRIKAKTAPLERELSNLRKERDELTGRVEEFEGRERQRKIHDVVREAALKHKVVDTAVEDVLMYAERSLEIDETGAIITKDGVGVTPGLDAASWLSEMQQRRPHWWPASNGGGARGSTNGVGFANNPWSKDSWSLTEQGKFLREHGVEKAEQLAKAAGSRIGATAPTVKN